MDQSFLQKSSPLVFVAHVYVFFLNACGSTLILHSRHKLLASLLSSCLERHVLDTTFCLQDVSIDLSHQCPFIAVGLYSCAKFTSHPCNLQLCFLFTYSCLPLELTSLLGHIYYPLSITLCYNYFPFIAFIIILTLFS